MVRLRSVRLSGLLRASALLSAFFALSTAHAQQVVFSEDFSSSLATGVANSSDYTLVAGNGTVFTGPPDYRVVANPNTAFTNNYSSYTDHTSMVTPGATSAMLFFDGSGNSSDRIYYHSVALTANVPYTISYWGASAGTSNVPVLNLEVNGTTIGSALTTVNAQWQPSAATFTPTTTATYTLAVYDSNTVGLGNDGSVDDFLVTAPVPEPTTLAALGLGVAAMLRRRKKA